MRRTRKRTTRQKGGAVPQLDPAMFGYSSGADLERDMDMFLISSHGEVTRDYLFTVVPPNTYFIFTAHSSEPAIANDPAAESYLRIEKGETREQYYARIYDNLFKARSERTGPQLSESLYIYEPGDLVPNYNLFFYNTTSFLFTHGLYRLPMERRFDTEEKGTYLGYTKSYIEKLLDEGLVTKDDIMQLKKKNSDYILYGKLNGNTDIEHKIQEMLMATKEYRGTKLYRKVERICCHEYPGNLLYSEPLHTEFQRELEQPEPVIQLAKLIQKVPYDDTKTKRLFFMHFCRVDYEHYSEVKHLMRTASFAGKCSLTDPNESPFNTFQVARALCDLSRKVKLELLKDENGRKLIRLLKSVIPPGVINWIDCIGDLYMELNQSERSELVSNYGGFINFSDMEWMAVNMPPLCKRLIAMVQNFAKKQAVIRFSKPFFYLENKLSSQIMRFKYDDISRKSLIKKIIDFFKTGPGALPNRHPKFYQNASDLHKLQTRELQSINNRLRNKVYVDLIIDMIKTGDENENENEYEIDMISIITEVFGVYFPEGHMQNTEFSNLPVVENVARNLYEQERLENIWNKNKNDSYKHPYERQRLRTRRQRRRARQRADQLRRNNPELKQRWETRRGEQRERARLRAEAAAAAAAAPRTNNFFQAAPSAQKRKRKSKWLVGFAEEEAAKAAANAAAKAAGNNNIGNTSSVRVVTNPNNLFQEPTPAAAPKPVAPKPVAPKPVAPKPAAAEEELPEWMRYNFG